MKRRALWETVIELVESVRPRADAAALVRIDRLDVTLPIEMAIAIDGGEVALLADAPRWRWRSDFDATPSRLRMTLASLDEGEGSPGDAT
jgi:hypothetical protein